MSDPNITGGLIGGALIGLASVVMLVLLGRIAGISGIVGGLLSAGSGEDRRWRLAFIMGLIAGSGAYRLVTGDLPVHLQAGGITLVIAGLLVGFGTRLGAGCTSGHGVCGIARRSLRSITATLTFMGVAMLTVFLTRHVLS